MPEDAPEQLTLWGPRPVDLVLPEGERITWDATIEQWVRTSENGLVMLVLSQTGISPPTARHQWSSQCQPCVEEWLHSQDYHLRQGLREAYRTLVKRVAADGTVHLHWSQPAIQGG